MNTMVHAAAMASESGMRRRRPAKVWSRASISFSCNHRCYTQAKATAPSTSPKDTEAPELPTGLLYYIRQYAGFVLCIISMIGTGWVSLQELSNTHMTLSIFGFLVLAAVALVLHELRPFVGPTFDDIETLKQQEAAEATATKRD